MKNLDIDKGLASIIELSRYFGGMEDYIIGNGGNTSFKTSADIWVKASGIPLGTLDEKGLVRLSREKLDRISTTDYSTGIFEREEEVRNDMHEAIVAPSKLMPSVETSLHNLLDHQLLVHTHPSVANGLLCSKDAKTITRRLFKDEVLFIEYTTPGYLLFKKVEIALAVYYNKFGSVPDILFLQNHGVIVGGNNIPEIKKRYSDIGTRIGSLVRRDTPDTSQHPEKVDWGSVLKSIKESPGMKDRTVLFHASDLSDHFTGEPRSFAFVSRPITPDSIIYCRSHYLFISPGEQVSTRIGHFTQTFGYLPAIIGVEKVGLFSTGSTTSEAAVAMQVFINMMRISEMSWNFGGPRFLTARDASVLEQGLPGYAKRATG